MSNNGNFLRTKSYVYGVILLKITSSVTHPYIYIYAISSLGMELMMIWLVVLSCCNNMGPRVRE